MIQPMSESGTKQRTQERYDTSNSVPHFTVGQLNLHAVSGQLRLDTNMFQEIDNCPYGLQLKKGDSNDKIKKK